MKAWLLDTHVWLWMSSTPEKLSPIALKILGNGANRLYFSAASSWEIAIKYRLGRLPLPESPAQYIASRMLRDRVRFLPIQLHHTTRVAELPDHHQDPFDRMLIAQAQTEKLVLISRDEKISRYDVELLLS